MKVRRHIDASAFLERAGDWLQEREAENNLILGLGAALTRDEPHPYEEPLYFATVETGDEIVGCALRTPPFKLALTRMPNEALPELVADVFGLYDTLDTVLGPEPTVHRFGAIWAGRHGGSAETGMRQGIYELLEVVPPERPATGILRRATAEDLALVSDWGATFSEETGIAHPDPRGLVVALTGEGALWVWEDREVVAMAAATGPTPTGIRVSYVYTPPAARGRGYASTLVAELSRKLLDGGRRACFLYTDLANPTSNGIYTRIGYELVCTVADVELTS